MSFFDIIGKDIKKKLDKSLGNIGNIGKLLTGNTKEKSDKNKGLLDIMNSDILSGITDKSKDSLGLFDNIKEMLPANLNFEGIFDGLKGPILGIIDMLKNSATGQFKVILEAFEKRITEMNGFKIPTSSAVTFEAFMKGINDIMSFLVGIKPFALFLDENNWNDESKTGIYYAITKVAYFLLISSTIALSSINQFFSALSGQKIREYYEFSKLDIFQYITLWRRGLIEFDNVYKLGTFLGYNTAAVDSAVQLTEFYPTARDLIDFAVREAFEPDEKLFIHGKNTIPLPFIKYGKTVGLTDEWIKKFWHSHWRLLGVSQILDAHHRGLIDETFLLDYLRRLDYTESDQKLIMDMSYNLLTRVDIRRVFENGLISSMELFEYYGKLGFSDNDKMMLTQLAKQLRFIETKDLRKLYIEQFEAGFLTESEIKNSLSGTGLDSDEISMYLAFSDSQKDLEFKLELKKQIEHRFYEGIIDYDELISSLRGLGVSNREIERVERNASLFNFRRPKLPTMAELKRYLKKEIISIDKFVYHALRLGLSVEHIEWILRDMEWLK